MPRPWPFTHALYGQIYIYWLIRLLSQPGHTCDSGVVEVSAGLLKAIYYFFRELINFILIYLFLVATVQEIETVGIASTSRTANRPDVIICILSGYVSFNQTFLHLEHFLNRFSGMQDQMAWSDLIPEVVLLPFARMRSKNMAQSPKNAFLA